MEGFYPGHGGSAQRINIYTSTGAWGFNPTFTRSLGKTKKITACFALTPLANRVNLYL